jgi:hypothetical protein
MLPATDPYNKVLANRRCCPPLTHDEVPAFGRLVAQGSDTSVLQVTAIPQRTLHLLALVMLQAMVSITFLKKMSQN